MTPADERGVRALEEQIDRLAAHLVEHHPDRRCAHGFRADAGHGEHAIEIAIEMLQTRLTEPGENTTP